MIPAEAAKTRPDANGCLAEPVRLVQDAVYHFRGVGRGEDGAGPPWAYPPGDYLLLAWGRHAHTHQELVCYVGLGGRDRGEVYFCPLLDWARMFTLRAAPPPPEKAAGVAATGSGV